MTLTNGNDRENHVVEFDEGARIAWMPGRTGRAAVRAAMALGVKPLDPARTRVTSTYDWTQLTDEKRQARARTTTADYLQASLDRLCGASRRRLTPGSGSLLTPFRRSVAPPPLHFRHFGNKMTAGNEDPLVLGIGTLNASPIFSAGGS